MKKSLVIIKNGEILNTFVHPDENENSLRVAWGTERYMKQQRPYDIIYVAEIKEIPKTLNGKYLSEYVSAVSYTIMEGVKLYKEKLKVFDHTLPQQWVDECGKRDFDPRDCAVWSYDNNSTLGYPFFLTWEALQKYRSIGLSPAGT